MATTSTRAVAGLAASLIALAGLTGCSQLQKLVDESIPAGNPTIQAPGPEDPVPADQPEDDYYTIVGTAEREHEPASDGSVTYCELDVLDRATCAYAELTGRTAGDSEGIDFDTPGWADNTEVTIPALEGVEGSTDYNGWFYNRSHLVADSLGGAETPENMVTGTRTQNVGSTQVDGQYAGGMAHTELIARDYIDSGAAATCPLYYAATPNYSGDDLVPRTVTVDIQSCDKAVDERVEVSNTANGFVIDYATGAWSEMD